MRLLSLCVYNPTITQDETTAHENIQAYYPASTPLDLQLNDVGLCTAIVAMQDRFSFDVGSVDRGSLFGLGAGGIGTSSPSFSSAFASPSAAKTASNLSMSSKNKEAAGEESDMGGGGVSHSPFVSPSTSAASMAKGLSLLNSIFSSVFPNDCEKVGEELAKYAEGRREKCTTAATAAKEGEKQSSLPSDGRSGGDHHPLLMQQGFNPQRRGFTTGTKRWLIVPVEKDFYVSVCVGRGPEGTVQSAMAAAAGKKGGDANSGANGASNNNASNGSTSTADQLDGDGNRSSAASSSPTKDVPVALMHPLEDDADDGIDDAIEQYVRCYYKVFKMMFGSFHMNYNKIVRPLTKQMLRAMASREEKEEAKAAREEEMHTFRQLVEQGLLSKLVPELKDWLLQSRVDGASFIAPFGTELLSISGPASLCVSSVIGVLHNAHPGALRGSLRCATAACSTPLLLDSR